MLEDLVHYWTKGMPPTFDVADADLLSLSYYPIKIAAGEFMSYANCMRFSIDRYIAHLQADFKMDLKALESDLRYLQGWKRRATMFTDRMNRILDDIERHNAKPSEVWNSVKDDYKFMIEAVRVDHRRLDSVATLIASLLQIFESRRSVLESASLTRLTYLALFFLPLTFVSGLFSMSGDIAPGFPRFWIYFTVAIPVTIATFGVMMYCQWFLHLPESRA